MAQLLLLHGPNLNLQGKREAVHYGTDTLDMINAKLVTQAKQAGHHLSVFQSNAEHELIERIHAVQADKTSFIIFNPAAFTHTSIALRDALLCVAIPFIEVHLSNIYGRESFRQHSFFSDIAVGVICGFGAHGYELAFTAAVNYLKNNQND
ncbi:MAG: type II 3-dehydroquinate dehydratase [Endozoicomonadaceae bacterium]|nr:type II 3-dehydroquinate dehydratase [Endozoicomonadaceae bacterium]